MSLKDVFFNSKWKSACKEYRLEYFAFASQIPVATASDDYTKTMD